MQNIEQFVKERQEIKPLQTCETYFWTLKKMRCLNCGIRHVTVPIATRILIANVRHIGLSNICVINLVYFKMQV